MKVAKFCAPTTSIANVFSNQFDDRHKRLVDHSAVDNEIKKLKIVIGEDELTFSKLL